MRPGTVAMSRDGLTIVSGTGSSSHKQYMYTHQMGLVVMHLLAQSIPPVFGSYYGRTVAISGDGNIVVAYNGGSSLQRYYVSSGSNIRQCIITNWGR